MTRHPSEDADRSLLRGGDAPQPEQQAARERLRLVSELRESLSKWHDHDADGCGCRDVVAHILLTGRDLEALAPGYDFQGRAAYRAVEEAWGWMLQEEPARLIQELGTALQRQMLLNGPYYESQLAAALAGQTNKAQVALRDLRCLLGVLDNPYLRGEETAEELGQEVKLAENEARLLLRARDLLDRRDRLLGVLEEEAPAEFPGLYDNMIVRLFRDTFEPLKDRLVQYGREQLRSPAVIGLGPAVAQDSIVWKEDGERPYYRIRWTWPPRALSSTCTVVISPTCPDEADEQDANVPVSGSSDRLRRFEVTPLHWREAGFCCPLPAAEAAEGEWVAVRAVVDLVFDKTISAPLVLGPLSRPGPTRGWLRRWMRAAASRLLGVFRAPRESQSREA